MTTGRWVGPAWGGDAKTGWLVAMAHASASGLTVIGASVMSDMPEPAGILSIDGRTRLYFRCRCRRRARWHVCV